ncbi:MAG: carbon-nitrogen hydrolase family protein [Lachnospiraceae bacterium]|nr:carbon-nitrogen hydrolase family protein [Lachnospiraceae bacterium]
MKIGAYQFNVTGNPEENFSHIEKGIQEAEKAGVRLLLFPECAVTGYPHLCIQSSQDVDFERVNSIHKDLQILARKKRMYLVVGTIEEDNSNYFNRAIVFKPDGEPEIYSKRALWGWDKDNFTEGLNPGIINIDNLRIGIRICFEVRFPEYFRELYTQKTDLNLILFYDVSDKADLDRYNMIKGHIQTRAVENVCLILACNTCSVFQTAPTILFDRSGKILAEMPKEIEGLMVYDYENKPLNYGEQGRVEISDSLIKQISV